MLQEEEWAKMESAYYDLMRTISADQRRDEIWEKGFDRANAEKLRLKLQLPSFWQIIEQKRINFVGGLLHKAHGKKAHRVMQKEEEDGGKWWMSITKDMQKYGFESIDEIGELKREGTLRSKIEGRRKREDDDLKNTASDALPTGDSPTVF